MNRILSALMKRVDGCRLLPAAFGLIAVVILIYPWDSQANDDFASRLDRTLSDVLRAAGFTGNVEATLQATTSSPNQSGAG